MEAPIPKDLQDRYQLLIMMKNAGGLASPSHKREFALTERVIASEHTATQAIATQQILLSGMQTLKDEVERLQAREKMLVEVLSQAEVFVGEELGVRRASFLPSDASIEASDDAHYVRNALEVLDALRAALSGEAEAI